MFTTWSGLPIKYALASQGKLLSLQFWWLINGRRLLIRKLRCVILWIITRIKRVFTTTTRGITISGGDDGQEEDFMALVVLHPRCGVLGNERDPLLKV